MPKSPNPQLEWRTYEAEVLSGLKNFASNELNNRLGKSIDILRTRETTLLFRYRGDLEKLNDLKTIVAIYEIHHFAIPRPKALLGHQYLTELITAIRSVMSRFPKKAYSTFRFSAAGKDSGVFDRLAEAIQQETGLTRAEEGDLLIRVRPSEILENGWEVLLRCTPRPLATRAWRVCDMQGALNATIAAAMVEMTHPQKGELFLNIMCGSGTLLIERGDRQSGKAIIGIDQDEQVLKCAVQNVIAAGMGDRIQLQKMDATQLQFEDGTFDAVVVDLPWGQSIGAHEYNVTLYPKVFKEVARVTRNGGSFVVLTHEVRLMDNLLGDLATDWKLKREVKVYQGGLHPRIYNFERVFG